MTRHSQSWQKVIGKLRLEYADLEGAVCEYAMRSNLNKMRKNLEEGKQLKVFVFSALDDLYAKASAEKVHDPMLVLEHKCCSLRSP